MSWRWIHQVLLGVDQLANAIAGGMADETLSARSYRLGSRDERNAEHGRWWYAWRAIDALFVWQDWLVQRRGEWTGARHCERAYHAERARLHMPAEYQEQRSAG